MKGLGVSAAALAWALLAMLGVLSPGSASAQAQGLKWEEALKR